jgi:hypothetical protein
MRKVFSMKGKLTPAWILYIPTSLRVGYNNNLLNVKTKIWADKIFTRR